MGNCSGHALNGSPIGVGLLLKQEGAMAQWRNHLVADIVGTPARAIANKIRINVESFVILIFAFLFLSKQAGDLVADWSR